MCSFVSLHAAAAASVSIDATPEAAASVPSRRPRKLSAKKKANTLPVPVPSTPAPPTPAPIAPVVPPTDAPTDEPTEEPSTLSPTDGLPPCDDLDGQYFILVDATTGLFDCALIYFDTAESLESFCGMEGMTCDSSKKCPELGFTLLFENVSYPPGSNLFGWTCGVSYISPEKPVAPCCETGSWLTCNHDRCESEYTKDFFCPDVDDYCNGFDDCFRNVCDCDEAKNDVCKWAEPDTPLPPSCDGQGDGQYFTVQNELLTKYECGLVYFDSAESLENFCGDTCNSSKTCPELGYTLVEDTQIFPPGHPLEGGCAVAYISPEKPVPPCCETGLWLSCNYDRCESEMRKDFVCPGFTDNEYCDGFKDCFGADVCDCDDARNDVCKWAEPDTPAPTDAPTM